MHVPCMAQGHTEWVEYRMPPKCSPTSEESLAAVVVAEPIFVVLGVAAVREAGWAGVGVVGLPARVAGAVVCRRNQGREIHFQTLGCTRG
jgi:hypothetical protein